MVKTYYKILEKYSENGKHLIEFEFSDDPEGFFLPMTVTGTSMAEVESKLEDFLGTNSQQIK